MSETTPEERAQNLIDDGVGVTNIHGEIDPAAVGEIAGEIRAAVLAEVTPMRQALIEADACVGLLVSCGKHGEEWKPEYEKVLEDYRDAVAVLQKRYDDD